MSYISVSQRQVAQRTGYIPVSQRRDVSSTQPIQPLVAFDFPRTAQASSPTAPSLFGMAKGTGQIAKTIGREIIRQPASVGVEISSRLDQLLGRPKIEQLAPSDFAKVPGLEKTARFLFGEEPVPSLDKRIAAGTEIAEKLGFEGAAAKAASGFFILGITGLDFLPFGGNVDDVVKALRAVNKAEDAAKILRTIGVAEDLIPEASIKFAKLTNSQEIKAGLETIAKTQQTTKFAKPKYVPVASRTLKTAPGEAIAPKVGVVSKELEPLAQEARVVESKEGFDVWLGENRVGQFIGGQKTPRGDPVGRFRIYDSAGKEHILASVDATKLKENLPSILEKYGVIPKTAIPKPLEPLAVEARKYKSAEEFVNNQKIVYHGTRGEIKGDIKPKTFFTTDKSYAQGIGGPNIVEAVVDTKNPFVYDAGGKFATGKLNEIIKQNDLDGVFSKYDSIIVKNPIKGSGTEGVEFVIPLKKGQIFTKSQLTDFYNQATAKVSEQTIPKPLEPLAVEARKYKSAEEFVKAFQSEIKHGEYWHITDTPSFKISSELGPRDLSSLAGGKMDKGKLMVTSDIEYWHAEFPSRKFAAKLDFSAVKPEDYYQVNRGFGNEFFVKDPSKIKVERVIPIEQAIKEHQQFQKVLEKNITSKSQLTDFYNQAVKRVGELPPLPKIATSQTTPEIKSRQAIVRQVPQPQPRQAVTQKPLVDTRKATPRQLKLETTLDTSISQVSKVVKEGTEKQLSASTYQTNRQNLTKSVSAVQQVKDGVSANLRSIGEGADKLLGTISTRLKNIDPSLKKAIRDFEFTLAKNTHKDRKVAEGFLRGTQKIGIEDYADLDLALKNGDNIKTQEIIKKYGLEEEFAKIRTLLDDLYQRAEDVGYDIGYEKNYFPRMIKDSEGLLEYLQKGDDWSIIDEAIKAKETSLGRYLDTKEKANLVNTLVRGFRSGDVTLSKTGAMKARKIDIVDAELNKFYRDSASSLVRYLDSTNDAIEARRFFGKGNKTDQFSNIDDSIGSYILNLVADGKVKPSQEKELRSILSARFAPSTTSGVVRVYKNLSYIDTMGSVISAITQLGDLAFSLYKAGPVETVRAFGRAIVGKSRITRADIGIEKIAQEFDDSARSANAVSKVFKVVGIEKLDALGKETLINATIQRYRKLASSPTDDFMRRIESVFGNDTDTLTRVMNDLKAGKTTEDTKLLAFNELLDVQPVALSEMPEQYLKGGNGRIFYMLKTYTVKLFDVYRNEVFQEIARNPIQGMKNLLALTGSLVVMNATADEIKDFMLNRETSFKDRTVDNILKLAGFSKFTIYKARQEGIGSAVAKTILPPFKFLDSAYKDIIQANEISQLETLQSIPVGGKLYYWWFGKGSTKTEKKRGADSGFPGLPELPELPKLPKLPELPKLPKF